MSLPHEPPPTPAVPFCADRVPAVLRDRPQWVCWRYEQREGKPTKVPVSTTTGTRASSTDPSTWGTFESAVAALDRDGGLAGVGYVFAKDDPFTGIDLDGCMGADGALAAGAAQIISDFASYTEVSPSGTGVKIICIADKPASSGCRSKAIGGFRETEVYSAERYFAITGSRLEGAPSEVRPAQEALDRLCARLWPAKAKDAAARPAPTGTAFEGGDEELLRRAFAARNGEKTRRLFDGDTSMHGDDDSAADLALCTTLAFWCGGDDGRIDRLFRRSGLYREKWDREDYRQRTIRKAVESCVEFYSPPTSRSGHFALVRPRTAEEEGSGGTGDEGGPRYDDDGGPVPLGGRDPASGRLVLSPKRTLPTARAFVAQFHTHADGPTIVSHADVLMEWWGNRYVAVEDGAVRSRLQPWLHAALRYQKKRSGDVELVPFESNPTTVKAAAQSVHDLVHLPASVASPCWLDGDVGRPPAVEVLPCRSMSLHVPTGLVIPATPALFTTSALDFDYDPDPEPPERWIKFLEQLWGDDLQSVELLQEWFGYCLIADTGQQKMLLLVGPRRSGKGTIGRVLRALVGTANVAGPTTASLAGTFGLQPLIGKPLAIVSDARFSGEGISVVTERLLCISGEDELTIDRKYLPSVTMKLPTRFVFLTNELPRFSDSSAALAGRFLIPAPLTTSFYGREDPGLTAALLAELPGILHWALAGWRRLKARGYFVQPQAGREAMEELEDLSSPVGAFVRECCVVGPGHRIEVDRLYSAWRAWCEQDGRDMISSKMSFGRDLAAAVPGVRRRRGTANLAFYEGITLGHKD